MLKYVVFERECLRFCYTSVINKFFYDSFFYLLAQQLLCCYSAVVVSFLLVVVGGKVGVDNLGFEVPVVAGNIGLGSHFHWCKKGVAPSYIKNTIVIIFLYYNRFNCAVYCMLCW